MKRAMKSLSAFAAYALAAGLCASAAVYAGGKAASSEAYAAQEFTYAEQVSKKTVTCLEMEPGAKVDLCFLGVKDSQKYTYRWTSSNESVATVDKVGVVTAVADGFAEITLTVGDGTAYTSQPVQVTVSSMKVTAGTADEHELTMAELGVGGTADLNFYGVRDWGSRKELYLTEWESSDPSVAAVSQKDGVVTGISKGTAVVFLWLYDMEKDILLKTEPVTVTVK